MKVAIVAHFSPKNTWDENFLEMLRVVEKFFEKTFVVTTAQRMPDLSEDFKKVTLLRRPNIGYDFYSYRVGMKLSLAEPDVKGIFLLNSSLFLLDSGKFRKLLQNMTEARRTSAVRGLTSSMQFGWHIQSYLMYFDLRYLPKKWLQNYFDKIEPANTKFEIILRYEVGLGNALKVQRIKCEAIFKPSFFQSFSGGFLYMRSLTKTQGWRAYLTFAFWLAWKEVNWTHFGAKELADCFGVVKSEFLMSNPHQLPEHPVWKSCNPRLRSGIKQSLVHNRKYYKKGNKGLTELISQDDDPLGIILQSIEGVKLRNANARIAVVVHLFYIDLFGELLNHLENILEPFDLYVTTPFEADITEIFESACKRNFAIKVLLCRNKGRDVGPFVALYRAGYLDSYDAVLKLHTKKSRYSDKGDLWRQELYKSLCGDSMSILRTLRLIRERECGMVGPARYFLTNEKFWGTNRERLSKILQSCDIKYETAGPNLGFFGGSMFWFAPKAIAAIHYTKGEVLEFDAENGKQDGALAHAWERAFCLLTRDAGYKVSSATLDGKDIFTIDFSRNIVPVL